MEKLGDITQADIDNGVLDHELAKAGIPDIQSYVKSFHQQMEHLMVNRDDDSDSNTANQDDSIVSSPNVQDSMSDPQLRPHGSNQSPLYNEQELGSKNTRLEAPVASYKGGSTILAERSPTISLDDWLKNFIPKNVNESFNNVESPKRRLNNYLAAAQRILSTHGSNVKYEPASFDYSTTIEPKPGAIANVKRIYSLWKVLDKNNDGKITVEDVQIMLPTLGLNFVSRPIGQSLIHMVDLDQDGSLTFHDFIALLSIIQKLTSAPAS